MSSVDGWISNKLHNQTVEHETALKRNVLLGHGGNLTCITR